MKKILSTLIIYFVLGGCQSISPKEETFKNPLFYKKMVNLSSNYFWDIKLTPTTMTSYLRHTDTVWVQKCDLIKNEETYIIMSCEDIEDPTYRHRTKCIIDNDPFEGHVKCYGSEDKYDDPEKHWNSIDNYTTNDPNYTINNPNR